LREAINATLEARETLSLFARLGIDDASKLAVYGQRLKKREQAERRILEALRQRP
jgi:hypothetical protein